MKFSNWYCASLTLVVALALGGCKSTPRAPVVGPTNLGYQCLPVPSEWSAAGSVISVREGVPFQLGMVEGISVKLGQVGFPKFSSTSAVEAGLVLNTLESFTTQKGWSANLSATAKSSVNVTTSYGGSTLLAVTEGQPELQAITWFKSKGFRAESGTRYYFVREAIQATEITYEVKRSDLVKLGGEAMLKSIGGKGNLVDVNKGDTYALNATFTKPVNVCIKPVELVEKGLSANGDQYFVAMEAKDPVLPSQ